ncbi:MAG: PTS IIA-like nitrogen regulatory protein PtsN [Pseudomonadales bacterium]|jgi:PTS system nitrogen regulatory IIA component
MNIERMLSPECTIAGAPGDSKKRVLELLAETLHKVHPVLDEEEVFDRLLERERLGSTGIGEGVAIPHCRLPRCCDTVGVLIQLDTPIDFEAIDNQPVDLIFALVVPEEATDEHLKALQAVAESFSQASYRERLRAATDQQSLYQAAISPL